MPMRPEFGLVTGQPSFEVEYKPNGGTNGELSIVVSGEGRDIMYGYKLEKVANFNTGNSLMFALKAWIGPELPRAISIRYSETFPLASRPPYPMVPETVIILTAGNPNGVRVPVKGPKPTSEDIRRGAGTDMPDLRSILRNGPRDIFNMTSRTPQRLLVLEGEYFKIEFPVNIMGASIKFDESYLDLHTAGISEDGLLWYEFMPIKGPATQVIVTLGVPDSEFSPPDVRTFNIEMVVSAGSQAASARLIAPRLEITPIEATLEFLGGVNIAVREVTAKYSNAQLYYVECNGRPLTNSVGSVYQLTWLKAVFRSDAGHVVIEDNGFWSSWKEPTYVPTPVIGNDNLEWPLAGDLGLEDAAAILLDAGPTDPNISKCTLSQPAQVPSMPHQPIYLFQMANGDTWAVGSVDKKAENWTPQPTSADAAANGAAKAVAV